jgi:ribosomal protein L16 Arg81 hydroxylase
MLNPHFEFEQLIHPISLDTFFSQYWEKRPLHISRKNPHYYSGLLSVKDIDTLLQFAKPKYPRVKLGRNKGGFSLDLLAGMETTSIQDYGVPSIQRLYDHYSKGDTLVIYKLEEYWQPLAKLCRDLAAWFSFPISSTLFLTPQNAQGFLPHFDHVDIFILQVEGSKLWRIYNTSPYLSVDEKYQPLVSGDLPAPEQEIYLEPGDFLYVPRGCIHEVLTTDSPSLHVAVDAYVVTWQDLISSALANISKQTSPFHQALPVGFLNRNPLLPSLQSHLTQLLDYLSQNANAENAVTQLAQNFIGKMQPLPDGHFSQLGQLEHVNPHTVVAKRSGMICTVFTEADQACIQFPGNKVKGPSWLESAFRFIAETETFSIQALPDNLSQNSKLVLIRRLIRDGLLRVVSLNQNEAIDFQQFELALNQELTLSPQ